MSDVSRSEPIVAGARCPHRVREGLRCPGRLIALPLPEGAAPSFRCNGPHAHAVEAHSPRPMAPTGT